MGRCQRGLSVKIQPSPRVSVAKACADCPRTHRPLKSTMAVRVLPLIAAVLMVCCAAASGARVGPKLDLAANLEQLRVRLLSTGDGFGQEGAARGLKQAEGGIGAAYGYGYYYGYYGAYDLPPCDADSEEVEEVPARRSLLSAELSASTRAMLDARSRNAQAHKAANRMMEEGEAM